MNVAAVIPTTGQRLDDLSRCLDSLRSQTRPVAEVLVVDSSGSQALEELVRRFPPELEARVVEGTTRGLTAQRNVGLATLEDDTDIVLFLDDDIELDERYVEVIAGHFESDVDSELGGVAGVTVNSAMSLDPLWMRIWQRLFVGRVDGRPRLTRGVLNLAPSIDAKRPMEADWLFGCAAYRTAVFEKRKFDEGMTGYALLEDVDFSLGVGGDWKLVVDPEARLNHHHGDGGRPNERAYARAFVENRHRILRRHRHSPLDVLGFWWTTFGYLGLWTVLATVGRRRAGRQTMRARVRGALQGIRSVLGRSSTPRLVAPNSDREPSISVAVLSVPGRERDLERCMRAVEGQSKPADEVIVVSGQPSYVSALREAWRRSNGAWIAFLDDDAIPQSDWLENIAQYLTDPTVGAVGGRILNFVEGRSSARRYENDPVARVSWFGRTYNRLSDIPTRHVVREVDFLQGSNMCVRRDALGEIDPALDAGIAPGLELALCQRMRRNGWRIIFDSNALVTHYPAPRPSGLEREDRLRYSREYSFVITYALVVLLPWPRRIAFITYFFLVGQRLSPGVLFIPYFMLPGHDVARFGAAWRGKLEGLKQALG